LDIEMRGFPVPLLLLLLSALLEVIPKPRHRRFSSTLNPSSTCEQKREKSKCVTHQIFVFLCYNVMATTTTTKNTKTKLITKIGS